MLYFSFFARTTRKYDRAAFPLLFSLWKKFQLFPLLFSAIRRVNRGNSILSSPPYISSEGPLLNWPLASEMDEESEGGKEESCLLPKKSRISRFTLLSPPIFFPTFFFLRLFLSSFLSISFPLFLFFLSSFFSFFLFFFIFRPPSPFFLDMKIEVIALIFFSPSVPLR